ncbi:hypothetical protein RAD15_16855 [Bradyrhizobium sp. 14AA]
MSGYLVRAGSDIRAVADVDRAGMRVGCIEGTSTSLKPDEAAELIGKGELDALAMGMGALEDLSRKLPGTKVLDAVIQSTGVVVVVPRGRLGQKSGRHISWMKPRLTARYVARSTATGSPATRSRLS